jgi:hypothetical protein
MSLKKLRKRKTTTRNKKARWREPAGTCAGESEHAADRAAMLTVAENYRAGTSPTLDNK